MGEALQLTSFNVPLQRRSPGVVPVEADLRKQPEEIGSAKEIVWFVTHYFGEGLVHNQLAERLAERFKLRKTIERELADDISVLPNKMKALVYLDCLLGIARKRMKAPDGDLGKGEARFCQGYEKRVSARVEKEARELFGGFFKRDKQAKRAIELWRSVIDMETSSTAIGLPNKDFLLGREGISPIKGKRREFFELLGGGNLDGAEKLVEECKAYCSRAFERKE